MKKAKRKSRFIQNIIVFLLVIVLVAMAAYMYAFDRLEYGYVEIESSNNELLVEKGLPSRVSNILLIGVDGDSYEGSRSDIMMILSAGNGGLKLTSVMRDTMVLIAEKETYEKSNHAYAYGGAELSLKTLNSNLDLNMTDFVAFNYTAIKNLVDAVGGVEVDVDQTELSALGNIGIEAPGRHTLSGDQALLYSRIRKNAGGDAGRNERQREILEAIFAKSTSLSISQYKNIMDTVLPEIRTSMNASDLMSYIKILWSLKSGEGMTKEGFPFDYKTKTIDGLSYVIPVTMESNVRMLHEKIYGSEYEPSDFVKERSNYIIERSGYDSM